MRPVKVIASVALSISALGLAVPTAVARPDGGGSVSLSPPTARSGTTVEVRVDCSAVAGPQPAVVRSSGFTEGRIRLRPTGREGRHRGEGTAVSRPGTYSVSGACTGDGSSQFSAALTVSGGGTTGGPRAGPATGPTTASTERPGNSEGSTAQFMAGVFVLAGAAAGGAWALRRRNGARS